MLYLNADKSIHLTRGDTAMFEISINNENTGKEHTILSDDILKFSVKKSVRDEMPCIQKVATGSNAFLLEPEDTKDLKFGTYVYDVELTTSNGDVYTVIPPTEFELMKEVT